jgi:hypothetical protein
MRVWLSIGMEKIRVLPYETVKSVHDEYLRHCEQTNVPDIHRAGLKAFGIVFAAMQDTVRLLACKGSFNTCEICNNANELLRACGTFIMMSC